MCFESRMHHMNDNGVTAPVNSSTNTQHYSVPSEQNNCGGEMGDYAIAGRYVSMSNFFVKAISGCQHTDWDLCETIRLQELSEARQRASQMENTMRWWSQCTAIWRQKWDTVRHERNRVREELIRTRAKLKEAKEELQLLHNSNESKEAGVVALKLYPESRHEIAARLHDAATQTDPVEAAVFPDDEDSLRMRIKELELENINALEMVAQLRSDNEKLSAVVSAAAATKRGSGMTPELSSPPSSASSTSSASYATAKSTYSTRQAPAEFTTTGEAPPQTPMYQYGGGAKVRRRNSLC